MKVTQTTPDQVRREIKGRGLPYDVFKTAQRWYVSGGDSHEWFSTSLNTYAFRGQPAAWWVDIIADMAKEHAAKAG